MLSRSASGPSRPPGLSLFPNGGDLIGLTVALLHLRDLGYRWGSLGRNKRINFHWATIQLPPTLVDYVIVHELAHIHEPNHTPQFWLRVERALQTFQAAKMELARVGSGLWLGPPKAQP